MNVPATKSLSARVMEWQARPLWRVLETGYGRELAVARALAPISPEIAIPMALRIHTSRPRWGLRSRPTAIETPLLPGNVLARLEISQFLDLRSNVRQIIGWEKDELGFPEAIPDDQMALFLATHAEWLSFAQKQAASGKVMGRGIRAKRRSMPFRDALIELQRQFDNDIKSA